MKLQSIVKSWVPPAIWGAARRRKYHSRIYPSFAEAAVAAADHNGYANNDLTRVTLQKTILARDAGLPEVGWHHGASIFMGLTYTASLVKTSPVRVLDFGGSFGFHALLCAKALPHVSTRWAVVESPAVADVARPIETDWLKVFSKIEDAMDWLGGVDLMHSSSTVHYVPDPDDAIRRLVDLGAPVMMWQRMMFANQKRTHVVQFMEISADHNGLGSFLPEGFSDYPVSVPCTYITEAELCAFHTGAYKLALRVLPLDYGWDHDLATFGATLLFLKEGAGSAA